MVFGLKSLVFDWKEDVMLFLKKKHYKYPIEQIDVFVLETTNYLMAAELSLKLFVMAAVFITGYKILM